MGKQRQDEYEQLRGGLKYAIRKNKRNCFKYLSQHADINHWRGIFKGEKAAKITLK